MPDSKQRFTNRVADYVKYRPRYPEAVLEFLQDELGLTTKSVIADVGSGTGLLAELFLKNGNYTLSLHDALPIIGRASCRERV